MLDFSLRILYFVYVGNDPDPCKEMDMVSPKIQAAFGALIAVIEEDMKVTKSNTEYHKLAMLQKSVNRLSKSA